MQTSLLGRRVFIMQGRQNDQLAWLGKIGRIVAVSQNEEWFRVVVNVKGMALATFDAGDVAVLPWWAVITRAKVELS